MQKYIRITNIAENHNYSMQHIIDTFKAFVEVVIPWSPQLAKEAGEIQYYGAVDLLTYEYLIQTLYRYGGSLLVIGTAKNLDAAAKELVLSKNNSSEVKSPEGVTFAQLTPEDRLLAVKNMNEDETLMVENQSATLNFLMRATMMGYYSEWYGYGVTRMDEPNQRVFEFKPISWEQVGYTGPRRE
jgi:hypothetical protein